MRSSFASILTIGDEVTSGQITNRNSQWLAQRLGDIGLKVHSQLSCNDERAEIEEALRFLNQSASTICLTGGLGPTTDDLTRDAVAAFTQRDLEFSEESWDRIVAFFQNAGAEPKETNRQQCFFPKGATIFPNAHGTADGFFIKTETTSIVVLPGPPSEVQPMWLSEVEKLIRPPQKFEKLTCWRLIGIGESGLQHEINAVPIPAGVRLGYRASMPIVEVKLWQPADSENNPAYQKFTQSLVNIMQPWLFEQHYENHLNEFFKKVIAKNPGLHIYDGFTQGFLHHILTQNLPEHEKHSFAITSHLECKKQFSPFENSIQIFQKSKDDGVTINVKLRGKAKTEVISLPFNIARTTFNQKAIAYLGLRKMLQMCGSL